MAGFYGADVEQLDTLASALEREGRALEDLLRRLDARLQSVPWQGPDAERSKNEWASSLFPRCLQAADGLVTAGSVVRRNAADQRDVSGGSGSSATLPGGLHRIPRELPDGTQYQWMADTSLSPADLFAPTREALESKIPGTPWTWGSIGGLIPGASDVLAVRDMADQMSQGQIPVHGMIDTAAGEFRKAGVSGLSPHLYLVGAALGTWNTAAEEFGKADFSAETRAAAHDFVTSDPWGAASAASEAVVSFLPNLVKNFL